jgi:hypothetical protein
MNVVKLTIAYMVKDINLVSSCTMKGELIRELSTTSIEGHNI